MARRRDLPRECNRGGAAAAADIDHAFARLEAGTIDDEVGNRLEQHVLRRLPVGPALAGGTVPVGDLVGVLFVGLRAIHGRHDSA
jgi:hypothetical protein